MTETGELKEDMKLPTQTEDDVKVRIIILLINFIIEIIFF